MAVMSGAVVLNLLTIVGYACSSQCYVGCTCTTYFLHTHLTGCHMGCMWPTGHGVKSTGLGGKQDLGFLESAPTLVIALVGSWATGYTILSASIKQQRI